MNLIFNALTSVISVLTVHCCNNKVALVLTDTPMDASSSVVIIQLLCLN